MLLPNIFGERLFDDFMDDFMFPTRKRAYGREISNAMRTDVKETDSGYELDIDLPGFKKENVTAELKDGYLTIKATTDSNVEKKDENQKYIRKERYYGSCSRTFFVGENVKQEEIKAKFEDGILKVSIPKKEEIPAKEKKQYIMIEG